VRDVRLARFPHIVKRGPEKLLQDSDRAQLRLKVGEAEALVA